MNLPPLDVRSLLQRYDLKPDKSLGQNFLVDSTALEAVVHAAEISSSDAVLEIGPGLGSLTRLLATSARKVVAVEVDPRLIPIIHEVLAPFDNVQIVEGDILAYDPARWMADESGFDLAGHQPGYLVVANIPYYITSALIRHLLEARIRPRRLVLTVQSEVAERICAAPGEMSLLALSIQVYGDPRIATRIPAEAFYPLPQVDSAVVRIDLYPDSRLPASHLSSFFRLAKAGFSQKRKTLRNSLAGGMGWTTTQAEATLLKAGIDPMRRAETLSLDEWGALVLACQVDPL